MSREEIFEKVSEVFQDVFDNDEIVVDEDTTASDVEEWDSLQHVTLMVAMEEAFSIKFKIEDMSSMKNVGAMVDTIMERMS